MIPIIYPFSLKGQSAKRLARNLQTKRVRPNGTYRYKQNHLIINLGNQVRPNWDNGNIKIINPWATIQTSSNKLLALNKLKEAGVKIPAHSINIEDARHWINDGHIVFCRTILHGSQGVGIHICKTLDELNNWAGQTKMFVKYFSHKREYRVFVFNGVAIDVIQKKRKIGFQGERNPLIKNLANGYIFARGNVQTPEMVKNEAVKAANALGLGLTGADVAFNEKHNSCVVLECNSNFGMMGTTLESVTNAIKNYLNPHVPNFNI